MLEKMGGWSSHRRLVVLGWGTVRVYSALDCLVIAHTLDAPSKSKAHTVYLGWFGERTDIYSYDCPAVCLGVM